MAESTHTIQFDDAECIAETDQAIRVTAPDFDEAQWIPKSAVHDDSDVYELGGTGTLVVAEWLARKRGWA